MTKSDLQLLGLMILGSIIGFFSRLLKRDLKLRLKIYKAIADVIKKDPDCQEFTNCRSVITGEVFDAAWIDSGCCPLISDQGYLMVCHGNPDGTVMIGDGKGGLKSVRIDDNRFTDIFVPGLPPITVLACYPGARPTMWNWNGRTFYNPKPNRSYVPMFLPTVKGTIVYTPMSYTLALVLKLI